MKTKKIELGNHKKIHTQINEYWDKELLNYK